MNFIKAIIILITITLIACDSTKFNNCNKKVEELEKENIDLKIDINDKVYIIDELKQEISRLEVFEPDNEIEQFTDAKIIELFKKDRAFYRRERDYKDFKVKKLGWSTYDLSYFTRTNEYGYSRHWVESVSRITILPRKKYKIELVFGAG